MKEEDMAVTLTETAGFTKVSKEDLKGKSGRSTPEVSTVSFYGYGCFFFISDVELATQVNSRQKTKKKNYTRKCKKYFLTKK